MPSLEDRSNWRKPRLFSAEPQMLLREYIDKAKASFHKSLRNVRSLFYGGYQKLPRSLSFNALLCGSGNARTHTSDHFYNEFYDQLQSELSRINRFGNNNISKSKESAIGDATSSSFMSFSKKSPQKGFHEERPKEKSKGKISKLGKKEGLNSQNMNKGAHALAQKMKKLDMMDDAGDLEHVLDIEEALHYYSRLRSPVYLDLVDQFFMDMHSELSVPQPSVSIRPSKSKQRLGSIRRL